MSKTLDNLLLKGFVVSSLTYEALNCYIEDPNFHYLGLIFPATALGYIISKPIYNANFNSKRNYNPSSRL